MINNKIPQLVEGIKFSSLKSVAETYGLKPSRIYKRYQRGERGDNLVPLKLRKTFIQPVTKAKKKFIVGNIEYKSIADACRNLGVTFNKFKSRIRNGWTIEEAFEIVPKIDGRRNPKKKVRRKKTFLPIIVFGKKYQSVAELSRAFGIKNYVLYQRISKYGITPEKAVLMQGKNKAIELGKHKFDSLADCARAIGIEPNTFYHLIRNYSINEIIGIEDKLTSRSIFYQSRSYSNQVELAEAYGLSKNQFYYRTYVCKMTLEEALDIAPYSSVVKSVFGNNGKIYVAEILNKENLSKENTKLYKVGVTQHILEKRLRELPFDTKIEFYLNGKLDQLRKIEKELKELFQIQRFNQFTASDFDGFSEIYQLNKVELERLKKLIRFTSRDLNLIEKEQQELKIKNKLTA